MAKFMLLGLFKTNTTGFIGIDIGTHAIKIVAISTFRSVYQVDAMIDMPLPKGVMVDHHPQDIAKINFLIKQLRQKLTINYTNTAIAITGPDVMTKVMLINSTLNEAELESQIEMALENEFAINLNDIIIDFEIIGAHPHDPAFNNVLVSTAHKDVVLAHVQCVDDAGLSTRIVDIASHALARAVNFFLPINQKHLVFAVVDLGASQTTLNVIHQGNVIFSRSHLCCGHQCTQLIADYYDLTFPEAEKMKISGAFSAACEQQVIMPFIEQLGRDLYLDLRLFNDLETGPSISQVMLTGGACLLCNLPASLEKILAIKVLRLAVEETLTFKNATDKPLFSTSSEQFLLALGLALSGAHDVPY